MTNSELLVAFDPDQSPEAVHAVAFVVDHVNCDDCPRVIAVDEAEILTVGAAAITVNACAFDVPPPGAEFVTVICAEVVATNRSVERIVAVNCVELPNDVARDEPLKLTVEPLTKFVPFTVIENCASPTFFDEGAIEVVVGDGFVMSAVVVGCVKL